MKGLFREYWAAEVFDLAVRMQLIDLLTSQTGEVFVTKLVALRLADVLFFVVAKRECLFGILRAWHARPHLQLLQLHLAE